MYLIYFILSMRLISSFGQKSDDKERRPLFVSAWNQPVPVMTVLCIGTTLPLQLMGTLTVQPYCLSVAQVLTWCQVKNTFANAKYSAHVQFV